MTFKNDKRRHSRLKHSAEIRLVNPANETAIVKMQDFSSSGLFLLCKKTDQVKIGDIVEVNTLEFENAPIQKARVARIVEGIGFGVEFIDL